MGGIAMAVGERPVWPEEILVAGMWPDRAPDWQDKALCAQTDPEAFFPENGGTTRDAKRVCAGCEVREECLQYALDNDEKFGVWGGFSERERRRLKKRGTELDDAA